MTELPLTGGCLCGGVRFELHAAPDGASYCHCTRCQRRTGTGASANAGVDGDALRITQGNELVKSWRHPDGGFEKCFCSECGSHLFSRNPGDHSQVGMRMGAFDGDPGVRPSVRQFVAYAAAWEPIPDDGLERFPESRRR
ncbi:MAG TPA: GFA family protein [Solirubrobacteraceae bacterium]|nr:GFA family protein [Solirubrobacteraceae bacterium]